MNERLISTSCDLCGSERSERAFEKDGYTGVRCLDCGLVYINPRPSNERIKNEIYNEGYFDAEKGYGIEDLFGKARLDALNRASELFKEIEKTMRPGAVLDIGCAAGFFIETARKRGWEPHGVEIGDFAARHAREKLNLDVRTGDFIEMELPKENYDLVLMMDVIEHLTSPRKGLEKVSNILKPGGLLVLETPNFESAPSRLLGAGWGLIAPEHHLYYFTPGTIGKMLEKTGFEIRSMTFPRWGLADLFLSAGSFRKIGIPVGNEEKRFVRRYLRAPRDMARAAANALDRAMLVPAFGRNRGVIIRIFAEKKLQ